MNLKEKFSEVKKFLAGLSQTALALFSEDVLKEVYQPPAAPKPIHLTEEQRESLKKGHHEKTKNTRCLICDTVGDWEDVSKLMNNPKQEWINKEGKRPTLPSICKHCGFVSHLDPVIRKDALKEYYKTSYRPAPQWANLSIGQKKLHMHNHFLTDVFHEWKDNKLEAPDVFEAGAAFGMLLNQIRTFFPKGSYAGTELTKTFKRVSQHFYDIPLYDEFDASKDYDLICSYKSAEHIPDIDREMREYVTSLKPDGRVYISVPIWFKTLCNFGMTGWDIGYYYHPNHINVWNEQLFEALLKKVGLEVIKKDDHIYDNTYLCKRNDKLMQEKPVYCDYKEVIKDMERIKQISDLMSVRDKDGKAQTQKMIEIWGDSPHLWTMHWENNRKVFNDQGFDWIEENIINKALEQCHRRPEALKLGADIYQRYEKYDKALSLVEEALFNKPNQPDLLNMRAQTLESLANLFKHDPNQHAKLLRECLGTFAHLSKTCLGSEAVAHNWMFKIMSELPTPEELGHKKEEVKDAEATKEVVQPQA